MGFSSLGEKPMRFAGQAKRPAGCRRARRTSVPAVRAKKSLRGVDHPAGFLA